MAKKKKKTAKTAKKATAKKTAKKAGGGKKTAKKSTAKQTSAQATGKKTTAKKTSAKATGKKPTAKKTSAKATGATAGKSTAKTASGKKKKKTASQASPAKSTAAKATAAKATAAKATTAKSTTAKATSAKAHEATTPTASKKKSTAARAAGAVAAVATAAKKVADTLRAPKAKKSRTPAASAPSDNEGQDSSQAEVLPMPQVGDEAPDFELPVTGGGTLSLSQFRGDKHVVLYFYPKDDTPGCTKQACTFQENLQTYDEGDAVIIGVSPDDLSSHDKFRSKYSLSFNLVADQDSSVARQYGAYGEKSNYGRTYMGIIRSTFLVGKDGRIQAVWPKVSVEGHHDEVLAELNRLNKLSESED